MPQEVEVFYVIPTIRRELAFAMKAAGKKQKEIAELLCVKESTISQYLNDKRATEVKLNEQLKSAATAAAARVKDKVTLIAETQKLLGLIKEGKTLCEIHRSIANIPKSCDVCFLK